MCYGDGTATALGDGTATALADRTVLVHCISNEFSLYGCTVECVYKV